MITALCGGVGGSKLALGLYRILPPDSLHVIVNTADDLELWGLRISPDLDTVAYTLGGIAQQELGWGIEGDTFHALRGLETYGLDTWFRVGDRDLATHIYRTDALKRGESLTSCTAHLASRLGIRADVLPMTDDAVATRLLTGDRWLDFQEYFVRERHALSIDDVRYVGVEAARPTDAVLEAIRSAEVIVLVNSNPVLSILPILSVPGIREAIEGSPSPRVAVSPMIGASSVTGPAGALMRLTGHPPTSAGLAALYRNLIDGIVLDSQDERQRGEVEAMRIGVLATNTIMRTDADRDRVAAETIRFARSLR
jgi:LPPG:FO 2-phospho-L-lactate transferase